MAVGVDRRAKKVAAHLDHALLLQPLTTAMSYHPMVQSPASAFPVPETTTGPPAEDPADYYQQHPDHQQETSPHQHLLKKRRASKDKTSIIRRSSSTPHMRNMALGTTSELSPTGDKRRNKLGYHRTSVACGHCRRRKIRCLVDNNEPTGRCANCIRLKKECNFYPVDQAPEPARPQPAGFKEANPAAPPSSSNTSSPRHPVPMVAKVDEFRPPFAGSLSTASLPRYEVPSESDGEPHHATPSNGLPVQQPAYGFPHPIDTQWPPSTGFLPSSAVSESPSSSTGYWRASPTTANSAFGSESNVSGARTPATISTSSTMSYGSHQDNQNWAPHNFQPPSRSMSYGNIEGLPQQFQNAHMGMHQPHEFRRTASYQYPTTIDTSSAVIHSTTLGPHTSAPLSAPIVSGNPYNYPPPWNPYNGGQNPTHDGLPGRTMAGQWYPEQGQLGQVQEEGGPPMTYGHPGMQHF